MIYKFRDLTADEIECRIAQVKENGLMAFECGDNQSSDIIQLFKGKFKDNKVIFDFNNIDRIVTFRIY